MWLDRLSYADGDPWHILGMLMTYRQEIDP